MEQKRQNRKIFNKTLALLAAALMLTSCGGSIGQKESDDKLTLTQTETVAQTEAPEETATPESETQAQEETQVSEEQPKEDSSAPDSGKADNTADDLSDPFSKAYALYRPGDNMILTQKNIYDKLSLASTTKLLTASVMLEYLPSDAEVTVGEEIYRVHEGSTLSYITPGTTLTVYDLLAAMLLPSGNDAAYTVAVNTARVAADDPNMSDDDAVDYFVDLMNGFAADLGMTGSHFVNPEGWDDPDHYTTVGDLLKLSKHVLSIPELREITSMHERYCEPSTGGSYLWENTNLFLDPESKYCRADCVGLKTGTTTSAGCCLVSAFNINGSDYVCIVMGCDENEERYQLANKIMKTYIKN